MLKNREGQIICSNCMREITPGYELKGSELCSPCGALIAMVKHGEKAISALDEAEKLFQQRGISAGLEIVRKARDE